MKSKSGRKPHLLRRNIYGRIDIRRHLRVAITFICLSQSIILLMNFHHVSSSPILNTQAANLTNQRDASLAVIDRQIYKNLPRESNLRPQQSSRGKLNTVFLDNKQQMDQNWQATPSQNQAPAGEPVVARNLVAQNKASPKSGGTNLSSYTDALGDSGSGNGPASISSHQSEKFDDTEDGDDDDDDDDYDYKGTLDSGSGLGNVPPVESKKPNLGANDGNNLVKKPTLNEPDAYLPFRPPANVVIENNSTGTRPPKKFVESKTKPSTIVEAPKLITTALNTSNQEMANLTFDNQNTKQSNLMVQFDDQSSFGNAKPATISPTSIAPTGPTTFKPNTTTIAQETTLLPKSNLSITATTVGPQNLLDDQMRIPSMAPATLSPLPTKYKFQNGSSLLRPNISRARDSDYDYEEENDDDESDDVSNFEDNDPTEAETSNKTDTNTSETMTTTYPSISYTSTTVVPKPQTSSRPILPAIVSSTTGIPIVKLTTQPSQPIGPIRNHSLFLPNQSSSKYPSTINLELTTTVRPITVPSASNQESANGSQQTYREGDESDEDEDDDEDSKEDDEVIEDEETDDEGAPSNNQTSSSTLVPAVIQDDLFSSPSKHWTTQSPPVPTYYDPNDGYYKYSKNVPIITQSSTSPTSRPVEYPPQTTITTVRPTIAVPLSRAPITTTTTSTTTTSTTTTTTQIPTTMHLHTTQRPIVVSNHVTWPTTIAPVHPSPFTTVRTTVIRYTTTPRGKVSPDTSRTSNILSYDRALQNDDVDLTKQLYDKAVEVYQATNQAIHLAIEAVWPPTFELNSSTFDSLLAQPFVFMLALGAAVIGLVLTMMLVVYIVTYQIQPKDDISIY